MLLFCDSFDHYTSANVLNKWSSGTPFTIAAHGRGYDDTHHTDNAALCSAPSTSTAILLSPFDTAAARRCLYGFALFPTVVTTRTVIARVESTTGAANTLVVLVLYPDGHLELRQGPDYYGSDPTALVLSTPALTFNHWSYIEVKISDQGNGCELRINKRTYGVARLISSSGAYTWNKFTLGGGSLSDSATWYVDDLYILDGKAVDQIVYQGVYGSYQQSLDNADFLNPTKIRATFPTSDHWNNFPQAGDEWTPSTGVSHYALIDDPTPDDDTTYSEALDPDLTDFYNYSDPLLGSVQKPASTLNYEIFGLQWLAWALSSDASYTLRPSVRTLTHNKHQAVAQVIDDAAYTYYRQPLDRDPTESGFANFRTGPAFTGDYFNVTMRGHAGQREFGMTRET